MLFLTVSEFIKKMVLCPKGRLRCVKKTLQCQKLSPPHAVSGKDIPGAFAWVAAAREALSLMKGKRLMEES